jgi:hypothetical protein
MFGKKKHERASPTLWDRVERSRCRRVAVLGLHPRAGTRTVLASLLRRAHAKGAPLAVTSAPRVAWDEDPDIDPATRVPVPEGAWIATTLAAASAGDADLELVAQTPWPTSGGPVGVYRVVQGGEVDLQGPNEPEGMQLVLSQLAERSGGTVLVDGGWERRAFAAPGTTDGVVLVLGAGFSQAPERAAAGARYVVETMGVPPCDEPARVAWAETASNGAAVMLDEAGRYLGILPPALEDPLPALAPRGGPAAATLVLPSGLTDEFMALLVRQADYRATLVVRDPTRIGVAPIYFKAWLKDGGRIQVVRPMKLIAVATNPTNPSGPDLDPDEFRRLVASTLPDLPVHDVVLESDDGRRKPIWKFWERPNRVP